jgi:hypothetical protein
MILAGYPKRRNLGRVVERNFLSESDSEDSREALKKLILFILEKSVEHSKIPFALSLSKGSGILEC